MYIHTYIVFLVYFFILQSQSEENDGVEDMFELRSDEAQCHCSVLSTILKIYSTVLAW